MNVCKLGEIRQRSYTLRIELRQEARWQGQVGIFWGLHADPETPGGYHAQTLLLQTGKGDGDQPAMRILRKKMFVGPEQFTTAPPSRPQNYSVIEPAAVPGRAVQLEIHIDRERVESIRYSGNYLHQLHNKELNEAFGPEFYQGGFGIFAAQVSGVTFENSSIRIEE
jgi:hypothetical protein